MSSVEQQFKVGDRVRFTQRAFLSAGKYQGELGTVDSKPDSDGDCWVRADRDGKKVFVKKYEIEFVYHQPTPRTITLDGITYTLTPTTGERQPQRGEVWRDDDESDYVLITGAHDENGDPQVVTLGGGENPVGSCAYAYRGKLTFAYPTLADAVAAGVLN